MQGADLLTAEGLGIMRGDRVLFSDVSLAVRSGDAIVLRGENGTGKTTLLRILAGLTRPDAGEITRTADHHWIGHKDALKPHETPRQHLRLWARAWGSSADIEPILKDMGLNRAADVPARYLSAGQRRRAALCRLQLEDRRIWLLDEPFTALDRDGSAYVSAKIEEKRQSGGAVLAALHGEHAIRQAIEVSL